MTVLNGSFIMFSLLILLAKWNGGIASYSLLFLDFWFILHRWVRWFFVLRLDEMNIPLEFMSSGSQLWWFFWNFTGRLAKFTIIPVSLFLWFSSDSPMFSGSGIFVSMFVLIAGTMIIIDVRYTKSYIKKQQREKERRSTLKVSCPACGWKGYNYELNQERCPSCGSPFWAYT